MNLHITVLICAGVVSMAYYITVLLEKENRHSHFVEISFDYGFFTLSAAGEVSSSLFLYLLKNRATNESFTTISTFDFMLDPCIGATSLLATACSLFKKMNVSGSERRRSRSRHRRSRSSRLRESRLMLVDTVESPPLTGVCEPPPPYSL